MIVKCVVACHNASGEPDFYFCKVECSQDQYDVGEHYEMAEESAIGEGYEGLMVVFDENDGPDFLFDHFVWESATIGGGDAQVPSPINQTPPGQSPQTSSSA